MKILAIRGRNLASLARSFEVDLTHGALAGVGLFAITGPVGAGKSTLLDALCLALFDRTPRLSGRGGVPIGDGEGDDGLRGNDPRTLLRRDAAEGHAEVDFRGRDGVRCRARWTVRRARRRIDGRIQDQEMSLHDLDRDVVLASGRKTDVLAQIELRLGLDFAQFCRSVLLAQGDFAAFLRASADERARLLENLTGAEVYRRLSRAAHEKRRSYQADVDRYAAQVGAQVLLEPEARAQLEERVRRLEAELAVQELGVTLAQRYVSWYADAASLQAQESAAMVALQAAIAADRAAADRRRLHQRMVAAVPLVPLADQVMLRQQRLVAASAAAEAARAELDKASAAVGRLRNEQQEELAIALPGERGVVPPLVADFERWQAVLARWVRARDNRTALTAQLSVLQGAAANAAAAVSPLQELAERARAARAVATAALATARAAVEAAQFSTLAVERRHLRAEQIAMQRLADLLRDWQRSAQDELVARQALADCAAAVEQAAAAQPGLDSRRATAEQRLQQRRHEQELARVRVDAAALRHHLVAGQPCPLCGALEHPSPAIDDDAASRSLAKAVAEAEAVCDAAREAARANEVQLREATRSCAQADRIAQKHGAATAAARAAWAGASTGGETELAAAAAQVAERQQRHAASEARLVAREEECARLQRAYDAARGLEDQAIETESQRGAEWQKASDAAAQAQRALEAILADLQRAQAETTECTQELDPALTGVWQWEERLGAMADAVLVRCRSLAATERRAREAEARCGEAQRAVERASAGLELARDELNGANAAFEKGVQEAGVRPVEVKEAAAIGAAALSLEGEQLRGLHNAVELARVGVTIRSESRRNHEAGGRPEIAESDAAQALEDAETARQRVRLRVDAARAELGADDLMRRARDEIAPHLRKAEQALEVWAALDDLIGSSSGDAFAVFAQSLTLDLLLAEANRRLQDIARRYRLEKNQGGEMDFVVVDLDVGGTRRSLQTLSGGETFLVSLALALALATLAAPRSRVETLFLDEGFGTLDAQHLEQALGALDTLQADGCQVGIISHVDGIAERIGACVEVAPEGAGQSRVRVAVR